MARDATTRRRAADDSFALSARAALGLYCAADFQLADGASALTGRCETIPQALWYFRHETIAVPRRSLPSASFASRMSVSDDLRSWLAERDASALEYPPLVWI